MEKLFIVDVFSKDDRKKLFSFLDTKGYSIVNLNIKNDDCFGMIGFFENPEFNKTYGYVGTIVAFNETKKGNTVHFDSFENFIDRINKNYI